MKKTYIALGALALTIITTVGLASATMASGKNINYGRHKTPVIQVDQAARDAGRAAMETKRTAVEAALTANDYKAFAKAEGENAPILKKINVTNFPRFVEARKLQEQARAIMTELGLENGQGKGMGQGTGLGLHQELNK